MSDPKRRRRSLHARLKMALVKTVDQMSDGEAEAYLRKTEAGLVHTREMEDVISLAGCLVPLSGELSEVQFKSGKSIFLPTATLRLSGVFKVLLDSGEKVIMTEDFSDRVFEMFLFGFMMLTHTKEVFVPSPVDAALVMYLSFKYDAPSAVLAWAERDLLSDQSADAGLAKALNALAGVGLPPCADGLLRLLTRRLLQLQTCPGLFSEMRALPLLYLADFFRWMPEFTRRYSAGDRVATASGNRLVVSSCCECLPHVCFVTESESKDGRTTATPAWALVPRPRTRAFRMRNTDLTRLRPRGSMSVTIGGVRLAVPRSWRPPALDGEKSNCTVLGLRLAVALLFPHTVCEDGCVVLPDGLNFYFPSPRALWEMRVAARQWKIPTEFVDDHFDFEFLESLATRDLLTCFWYADRCGLCTAELRDEIMFRVTEGRLSASEAQKIAGDNRAFSRMLRAWPAVKAFNPGDSVLDVITWRRSCVVERLADDVYELESGALRHEHLLAPETGISGVPKCTVEDLEDALDTD